ncbi:50S ribosomal protein L34 [Vulcanisaeta souniana]|uniref:Large ribosomal subunit protein eL34 n=1 Tax=Vulcanisaeta souniana JCM 11219 TaxID=1293586 RepID=A0A830E1V4_9CREN|nr:50S ribosomal protein L34 [Vulcanisaeta souniana]BDR92292.1 50S ribosomal protein L34e [Vulcanisaeta souniana JCM 11219]GGI74490.1 50S ribosomal protein L34e [Vulcanisaeta souniana JCM 11219]
MPRPALRSRRLRRISKKTPGGRRVVHYDKRFASKPRCAICGRPLNGINETRIKTEHVSGSTISRPYGGYICHRCLALALRIAVRLS